MEKNSLNNTLQETLKDLEISINENQLQRLATYATELLRWNKRTNLTGASNETALIRGPLFDALTLIPVLLPSGTLVDIGAGGGLPGIPAALICDDITLTLVEPRARRATFLKHICHKLSLNAEVVQCRDNELKSKQWQGAVAQAVWAPEEWIPRGARIVQEEGVVYVLSSKDVPETTLSQNTVIEARFFIERPMDNAARYAFRIRTNQ